MLPSFCMFYCLLCLTIDLCTSEIRVKNPKLDCNWTSVFQFIFSSTMTFFPKVGFPKMLCFQQIKKGEYFSLSMSCLSFLLIQWYKPKKNLTVHILYACEVLLDMSDGIKYTGWKKKKKKQTHLFVFSYFLLKWKSVCQQKCKYCIRDIKQWIKK